LSGRVPYLVLGSGPAGARAAETLRKTDRDARIVVASADPRPFYNRILLSKEFLYDDAVEPDDVVLRPVEAWESVGIELRPGVAVERLDPEARSATLEGGETIAFERCLVATGSRPAPLPVPGGGLPGVHTLRTLDDAIALRRAAREADRAVVVGGGLIGLEVSAALAGRDLAITLLAREEWLYGHVAPPAVGRVLKTILERGGVNVRLETTVVAIEREGDGLEVAAEGGEVFRAPLVPVGVGVRMNTGFLAGTGLLDEDGAIRVDSTLATGAPGIWAAGDVAAWDDPLLGVRHRVEHWLHAMHQGARAASNMTGDPAPYDRVTAYDTELFGVPVTAHGDPRLVDRWEVEAPGEELAEARGFRDGRPTAAFRIGSAGEEDLEAWIREASREPA